jgi:protein phosphatase
VTALRGGAATDVGRVRQKNEDNLLVAESLFAVADGMGGHAAGEVASETAVNRLGAAYGADHTVEGLVQAIKDANRAVWRQAQDQAALRGMGTTLTAAALVEQDGEELLAIANVGDSRAYLLRDGELEQLTADHSVAEELRRDGRLTTEEAEVHPQRHVLTRVLGIDADVDVDVFPVIPYRGDRVLLASDGLTNEVRDDQIASVLRRLADPAEAARELVSMAKANGGNDNITVVVVDVVDDDDRARLASEALGPAGPAPARVLSPSGAPPAAASAAGSPPSAPPGRPVRVRAGVSARVVIFVAALLLIVGGAFAAIAVYARGSYFVGFKGERVAIFKGRPGGLLWFDPTLAQRTALARDRVPPSRLADVRAGKEEPSLAAARRYVRNLQSEADALNAPPATAP